MIHKVQSWARRRDGSPLHLSRREVEDICTRVDNKTTTVQEEADRFNVLPLVIIAIAGREIFQLPMNPTPLPPAAHKIPVLLRRQIDEEKS